MTTEEILQSLCYYDKRNPDCTTDDEDIEDHEAQLLRVSKKLGYNKTCSCDNCFYGRTRLAGELLKVTATTNVKTMSYELSGIYLQDEDGATRSFEMCSERTREDFMTTLSKEGLKRLIRRLSDTLHVIYAFNPPLGGVIYSSNLHPGDETTNNL
jgi:hypothetical protein